MSTSLQHVQKPASAAFGPGPAMLRAEQAAARRRAMPRVSAPSARPAQASYAALDLGTNNCRLLVARAGARRVPRRRRVLAHRPAGRGAGRERRAVRGGDGAHDRGAQGLRRQDRPAPGRRRPLCRHRGLPPRRELRRVSRRGCATRSASSSRSSRPPRRRGSSSPAARRCCTPRIPYAIVFDIGGGSTEIVWLRQATARAPARAGRRSSARSRCRSASSPLPSGSAASR